jgi:hypothetical protein
VPILFLSGQWLVLSLASAQTVINTLRYGLSVEGIVALTMYCGFAGWVDFDDMPLLDELNRVCLRIMDER